MRLLALFAATVLAGGVASPAAAQDTGVDGVERLVFAIESAIRGGDESALRGLATDQVAFSAPFTEFSSLMVRPAVTDVTVKERDRSVSAGGRLHVIIDILTDRSRQGMVSTWRIDPVPPARAAANAAWRIGGIEKLTVVSGIYRLALDTSVEYDVHQLVIKAPDLTLSIPSGRMFVAENQDGPTAVVVLGRGNARFAPGPEAERGQVRIFCGSDVFSGTFDSLFFRMNPAEFRASIGRDTMVRRAPHPRDLRRASAIFEASIGLSFGVGLGDLSAQRWSLVPTGDDFVAEIDTKKYGSLTYAHSNAEPEDISFFDRKRRRNISIYASQAKLEAYGRFFDEDALTDYDVLHYDIEASFSPDRQWIDGVARVRLRTRDHSIATLQLHLADSLVARSIVSPTLGRLLHLRVVGQNALLIGLPDVLPPRTEIELVVTYGGRLPPQPIDREAVTVAQDPQERQFGQDTIVIPPEPKFLYSNRTFWYPQATVTDYATARLQIAVPAEYGVVASGAPGPAVMVPATTTHGPLKQFTFEAREPARYLSVLISRFQEVPAPAVTVAGRPVSLRVEANPRQLNRARAFGDAAASMLAFFGSMLGDAPYPSVTVALTESDLPAGHSPPYFAVVDQPLPTSPFTWTNDPVAFPNYPYFFLAHELAHQWWGEGVGWKNYHEQWLSEGFSQYFAALYAEKDRGADTFASILKQMRKTAMAMSPQGPVYLGYRLGHIRGDSRVFRAVVYNKGAMVLHMLRRLVGDDAFFAGLKDFYTRSRFTKAGTDDFRQAMERASGQPLERFFDRWIYGSDLPRIRYSTTVSDRELHVRFEQRGEIFDVPVTVTLTYTDGTTEDVVVALHEAVVERSIPLRTTLQSVDVNRDSGALADFSRAG